MARIVVMDDSRFQRKVLVKMLQSEGHEVIAAEDGHEGLFKIATFWPDLAVCDLVMPKVDGLEVLETIHYKQFPVATIVISADIQEVTHKRCIELGLKHFIRKPIKEAKVKETVQMVLAEVKKGAS